MIYGKVKQLSLVFSVLIIYGDIEEHCEYNYVPYLFLMLSSALKQFHTVI